MLVARRQVTVDIEFPGIGEDILHVMGGGLSDVYLRAFP